MSRVEQFATEVNRAAAGKMACGEMLSPGEYMLVLNANQRVLDCNTGENPPPGAGDVAVVSKRLIDRVTWHAQVRGHIVTFDQYSRTYQVTNG